LEKNIGLIKMPWPQTTTQKLPTQTNEMTCVKVSTLGGEDIVVSFQESSTPPTTGDLLRELATRVPNHRATFLLYVNDAECPVEGDAADADLTAVVDFTKDVTLIYKSYKAFDTGDELRAAVGEWVAGGERKAVVSERYGHRIGEWDVSDVTDMSYMFHSTNAFDDDISGWDTSNVTDMREMFRDARAFNGDVSRWDTSNVTTMFGTFAFADAFNGDISRWDVSNVTTMYGMFCNASVFDGDLSGWDTSNVVDMNYMFCGALVFNCDISGWDTSNVTKMDDMFQDASAFNGDLSGWDTSSLVDIRKKPQQCGV
jgi:surface protein